MQLGYNADHELAKSVSIVQQGFTITIISTDYYYDAFGRRIFKHSESKKQNRLHADGNLLVVPRQPQKTQQTRIRYLWDGNRQLQEQTDTHVFTTVYEQDSFEPVARLVWLKDELTKSANDEPINNERLFDDEKPQSSIQVFHYHNDHLGTPNELTNHNGEVVWLADYETW